MSQDRLHLDLWIVSAIELQCVFVPVFLLLLCACNITVKLPGFSIGEGQVSLAIRKGGLRHAHLFLIFGSLDSY